MLFLLAQMELLQCDSHCQNSVLAGPACFPGGATAAVPCAASSWYHPLSLVLQMTSLQQILSHLQATYLLRPKNMTPSCRHCTGGAWLQLLPPHKCFHILLLLFWMWSHFSFEGVPLHDNVFFKFPGPKFKNNAGGTNASNPNPMLNK